jgi:hypothetical protein
VAIVYLKGDPIAQRAGEWTEEGAEGFAVARDEHERDGFGAAG